MKELNIGDRLEYEDGRGATVLGKWNGWHPLGSSFLTATTIYCFNYRLEWDKSLHKYMWYGDYGWNCIAMSQVELESCNMRIVKKDGW